MKNKKNNLFIKILVLIIIISILIFISIKRNENTKENLLNNVSENSNM